MIFALMWYRTLGGFNQKQVNAFKDRVWFFKQEVPLSNIFMLVTLIISGSF